MGYTHYATLEPRTISNEEWGALLYEVMTLNMDRLEHPTLTDDLIEVRGSHEDFTVKRDNGGGYMFTKTRRAYDYDHIIVACYMALYRCVRGVKISSDGEWNELRKGREYYLDTFSLKAGEVNRLFAKTIHDPRQKWFIGNPIYACDEHDKEEWYDFLSHTTDIHNDDGTGITFMWKWGQRVWVHNTDNMGNTPVGVRHDGEEHRIELGNQFAVLPAPLFCEQSIKDFDTSDGRYAIVCAAHRPVFEFDKNDFPRMTYTIDRTTGVDTNGHSACEACGKWVADNNIWHDANGDYICADCHGEEDEGEDY